MTPRPRGRLAVLAVALAALCAGATAADVEPARPAPLAATPAQPRTPATRVTPAKAEASPTWGELTPAQQQALGPLTGSWSTLTESHKRKWLAVSANYPAMPAGEQARLHTRMAEWATLSPQQRSRARQNYFETQALPGDDKKAKWEAYQALPAEAKKKLQAGAAAKPVAPPTAAAVQPVPQRKLATVPRARQEARTPRIAVVPSQVDNNTLLPQPGAVPVQP